MHLVDFYLTTDFSCLQIVDNSLPKPPPLTISFFCKAPTEGHRVIDDFPVAAVGAQERRIVAARDIVVVGVAIQRKDVFIGRFEQLADPEVSRAGNMVLAALDRALDADGHEHRTQTRQRAIQRLLSGELYRIFSE